ncbi:uncharacterized protein [Panulirus ornatus]|uniref:uncharacterized protein n=1 Tax=Panulirus ornatus TaxID=150431 RepID=UPI003A874D65
MTSQHSSCAVVYVFVLVGVRASSAVAVSCPGDRDCATQHKIQTINWFFDHINHETAGPPFTLKDIGNLVSQYVKGLNKSFSVNLQETPKEARQYYGATGYGNYYGNTGYPSYGLYSAGSSSTSFNGLDAGLSALAFLAFGVWLFNLVLPQLQGSGLGLPGLRRRNAPEDASEEVESNFAHSSDILSNILSSSRNLVNNIFNKDTFRQSKHFMAERPGVETEQARFVPLSDKTRESILNTGDFMDKLENLFKAQAVSGLQQEDSLITDVLRNPLPVLQGSSSELNNQMDVPEILWNSSETWKLSEVNVRRRRRVEGAEDQGMLGFLLGQAWQHLSYILNLLEELDG